MPFTDPVKGIINFGVSLLIQEVITAKPQRMHSGIKPNFLSFPEGR